MPRHISHLRLFCYALVFSISSCQTTDSQEDGEVTDDGLSEESREQKVKELVKNTNKIFTTAQNDLHTTEKNIDTVQITKNSSQVEEMERRIHEIQEALRSSRSDVKFAGHHLKMAYYSCKKRPIKRKARTLEDREDIIYGLLADAQESIESAQKELESIQEDLDSEDEESDAELLEEIGKTAEATKDVLTPTDSHLKELKDQAKRFYNACYQGKITEMAENARSASKSQLAH